MSSDPPAGVAPEDWRAIRGSSSNVLVVGPDSVVADFLEALVPLLTPPVVVCSEETSMPFGQRTGSIILRDVAHLAPDSQRQLLDWLGNTDGQLRMVSTSGVPLYQLVERGAFADALYYRLNVITVNLPGAGAQH